METLSADVLLYISGWLNIRDTLKLFSVCKRHHQIAKLRKFWLSISRKFWHDLDLTTIADENIPSKTIEAYHDYHKGTHFVLYVGLVPYDAMPFVINIRDPVGYGNDIIATMKGPRSDGKQCLRYSCRLSPNYHYDYDRRELCCWGFPFQENHTSDLVTVAPLAELDFRPEASMFRDFAFPYFTVEKWTLYRSMPDVETCFVFTGTTVCAFYEGVKERIILPNRMTEIILVSHNIHIAPGITAFSIYRSSPYLSQQHFAKDIELSIYPDRPMNLCFEKDVGFRCM